VAWRQSAALLTPGQHAFTGFALDLPHDAVSCAECHDADQPEFVARHPGRSAEACSVCHADPHGGQFHSGPFAGQECTACHSSTAFAPTQFGVEHHALAALPLDGLHLSVECNACHTIQAEGAPRAFRGIGAECAACHLDAHEGFFDERLADAEPAAHGACALCHTTAGFDAAQADFDHELWTGFAVRGSHAQEGCASCHPSLAQRDDLGRVFGRVEEAFGTFEGCVTCHSDPHEGRFDAPHLPAVFAGAEGCARCHEETSFRSFPHGFDHGLWTGFTLAGGHGEAACSACHVQLRVPDEIGRTWGPANGASCRDCHPDPHAGQFQVEGATDCERCHASERTDYLSFDHDRDSRFRLGDQHAHLECAACHLPYALPSGQETVRYRPLGTECVDCHGVQEEVLIRRRRK
jgi:hypothetical protein